MPEPVLGVRIDAGLAPFQIIQQDASGGGSVSVSGRWGRTELPGTVELRVAAGADGRTVCPWQPARRQTASEWEHTFDAVPAGGLYRLESRLVIDPAAPEWGVHGDTVHHWGVGDLWIIAGQSNAAGYGRGPVHDPPELGVHLLRNDERWDVAAHPLNDTTGSTHPNLEAANPGHSPYLCFARELRAILGYPIGLIQTALGGSALAAWNPAEDTNAPLYRNLIQCVNRAGGAARGLLWYQGESDCSPTAAPTYEDRFAAFVTRLRADLRSPDLPVLIAQLNRYTAPLDDAGHRAWSLVREAQRQAVKLGHVAVIPTLDLPLSDAIHTSSDGNLTLGHRKARAALAVMSGRGCIASVPDVQEALLSPDQATLDLTFARVPSRLAFLGPGEGDFTVEDADGFITIRAASVPSRDRVRLELDRAAIGEVRVHCGYGANPPCVLRDAEENVPVLAFYGFTASLAGKREDA
jgi:sialate O-acetylesterase